MKYWWGALVLLCAVALADERRVLLRDIPTLLFEEGKMSTAFRTDPVPQLAQTGGPRAHVPKIWCKNAGWDGRRVLWECRLPDDVPARLGKFEVSCEGFDRAGDPYILAGSCGIEYELTAAPPVRANNPVEFRQAPPSEPAPPRERQDTVAIIIISTVILATLAIVSITIGIVKLTQPELSTFYDPGPPPSGTPPTKRKRAPDADEVSTEKKVDPDEVSTEKKSDVDEKTPVSTDILEMSAASDILETYETMPVPAPAVMYDELPTKKTERHDQPTRSEEGWSDFAMLGATAGSFLLGRMTAPAQRSPSPPRSTASTSDSWFGSKPSLASPNTAGSSNIDRVPNTNRSSSLNTAPASVGGSNTDRSSSSKKDRETSSWGWSSTDSGSSSSTGRSSSSFGGSSTGRGSSSFGGSSTGGGSSSIGGSKTR